MTTPDAAAGPGRDVVVVAAISAAKPSSSSGRSASPYPPPPPPGSYPSCLRQPRHYHHHHQQQQHQQQQQHCGATTFPLVRLDPNSITPSPSDCGDSLGEGGGLGRDLAMEATTATTTATNNITARAPTRSERDSQHFSRSVATFGYACSPPPSSSMSSLSTHPCGSTSPFSLGSGTIFAGEGGQLGRSGSNGRRTTTTTTTRRKVVVVARRRRLLKTPGTAAANGSTAGTPDVPPSSSSRSSTTTTTTALAAARGKTPPSLREEEEERFAGSKGTDRKSHLSSPSGKGGKEPGSAPPSVPSPPAAGIGSDPSSRYSTLAPSSSHGGGRGGAHLMLRPRPSAPPTPDASSYLPSSSSSSSSSSLLPPPPPPPSLFPDPSSAVDQSELHPDDSRFWSYDVGSAAHPRSANSAAPACGLGDIPSFGIEGGGASTAAITWSASDFDLSRQLGKGKFGIVYGATEKGTGKGMALKVLSKARVLRCNVAPSLLRREVEIQARLRHDNIVRLHGYFHDDSKVCLLLQHAPDGDLYQLMSKRAEEGRVDGGALPHAIAASFTAQVASALSYLGNHHVAHRDIKPENLLLSGAANGELTTFTQVRLADFGWAVHAPPPLFHRRSTLCGTPEYVPPEMVQYEPHSTKRGRVYQSPAYRRNYDAARVDAWALGVLACEMVGGRTPFFMSQSDQKTLAEKMGYSAVHETVFDLIRSFRPEIGLKVIAGSSHKNLAGERDERDFVRLVRDLLQDVPERRMNVSDVAFHPWVTRNREHPNRKRVGGAANFLDGAARSELKRVKTAA